MSDLMGALRDDMVGGLGKEARCYILHAILSIQIVAFVCAFKWISLTSERGRFTKYVGVSTGLALNPITTMRPCISIQRRKAWNTIQRFLKMIDLSEQ